MKQHQKTLLILAELDEHYKVLDMDITNVAFQEQRISGVNRKSVPCPNCAQCFFIQLEISINNDCLLSDSENVVLAEVDDDPIADEFVIPITTPVNQSLLPMNYIEIKEISGDSPEGLESPGREIKTDEELEDYQKPLVQDAELDVVGEVVEEKPDGTRLTSSRIYKIKEITTSTEVIKTNQNELFECSECHEKFKTKYSYRVHKNIHTEKYKCTICEAAHSKKERLLAHLKREHTKEEQETHHAIKAKEKEEEELANNTEGDYYIETDPKGLMKKQTERATLCITCGNEFGTIETYFSHVKNDHGMDTYICGICGKMLKSRKTFKHHIIRTHTDKAADAAQVFNCRFCDAKYLLQRDLNHHVKLKHTREKDPIECSECGQVFYNRRMFYSHRLSHSAGADQRPHTCEVCNKSFSRLSSLKDHLVTHTGERKFTCSICHQKYPRKSYLRIHMRIHTGHRPYLCNRPGCDVRFYDPASLRQHRLMHERKEAAEENTTIRQVVETSEFYYYE